MDAKSTRKRQMIWKKFACGCDKCIRETSKSRFRKRWWKRFWHKQIRKSDLED